MLRGHVHLEAAVHAPCAVAIYTPISQKWRCSSIKAAVGTMDYCIWTGSETFPSSSGEILMSYVKYYHDLFFTIKISVVTVIKSIAGPGDHFKVSECL
jgi:hypothetical protein